MPSVASRDCRSCHKRRIRCDRTLPTCQKCDKKNIECPGYGTHIRWANAVAVRGHLAGLSTPVVGVDGGGSNSNSNGTKSGGQVNTPPSSATSTTAVLSPGHQQLSSNPTTPIQHASPGDSSPETDRILHHFVTQIAPSMVWLDSDANCYRRIVPALARRHPVLLLAIQAICSSHLAEDKIVWEGAGKSAINMITESIRPLVMHGGVSPVPGAPPIFDIDSLKALLVSMMVLSNVSLLHSDMGQAQFHRQAARIVVNALTDRCSPDDELFCFIRNQLAIYEALASTTLSDIHQIRSAITPREADSHVPFSQFLTVLHQVTQMSMSPPNHLDGTIFRNLTAVQDAFEQALCATMLAAAPMLHDRTPETRKGFTQIVQLYHHAALVYACDRLGFVRSRQSRNHYADSLFCVLLQFRDSQLDDWIHDLPWPVFMAGICAVGEERQTWVRIILNRICVQMSYQHYKDLLAFLDALWRDPSAEWTVLARQWEQNGKPLIAI